MLVGAALLLAACGESGGVGVSKSDDNPGDTLAAATTTAAEPTTTVAEATTTTGPTIMSTQLATTLPPTTTAAPTTTEAPTTTIAGIPSGWRVDEFPDLAFPPCCASNWYGQPSPAVPVESAAPLPDGIYRMIVSQPWDPGRPNELVVELHRFEQCSVLPEGRCELYETYEPDELGYEETAFRTLTLPLDATIEAGVVGWSECTGAPRIGNGADLATLITAFDTAYGSLVWPRIAAGEDPSTVVEDLNSNPQGGFGPPSSECAYGYDVVFDAGTGAPPLLLQVVTSLASDYATDTFLPLAPMEELFPTVLEVTGGVLRAYFYAGFYS